MSISVRLGKLREELRDTELDAMLISGPENRRYLSGFTGSAGYLLISQDQAFLATDFRYIEQAGRQAPEFQVQRVKGGLSWFPTLAKEMGIYKIGFEAQDLTVGSHTAFQKAIREDGEASHVSLVETTDVVDHMRARKDQHEMGLLARAIEITDQAFEQVVAGIEPGATEGEIAWELEKAMRERGAEGMAFDIIVASGPNGALPHHRADDTVIERGQPVVIDMGASFQGYCADMSRTVLVGEADRKFWEVYNTVLRAQHEAEAKARPGMTGAEVDAISREIIADAGYGDNFGHSLGHGVGLAVHEYPLVGPKAENRLEEGMVFTIEPGIYLSDWGGVRIEDIVVLENGRARVISAAPKLEGGR